MSSTITGNDGSTPARGIRVNAELDDPIDINIGILNPTVADAVALDISMANRYLIVAENFLGKIRWNLNVPSGVTARFDNPPLEFAEIDTPAPVRVSDILATVDWANNAPGLSFHYTLYVLIEIDESLVLISHDPTVHNDPPTP
jgi:hypothetical protein